MDNNYCLLLAFFCFGYFTAVASAEERSLFKNLFENYTQEVRPRLDATQAVHVTVDLEINQIKYLDERSQTLHTIGFIEAEWHDDYLLWNPENYSNITEIVVPPNQIWLPDFGIQNSAETFYVDTYFEHFRVHVNHTGRVIWKFGGLFDTSCEIDTLLYPFDLQKCQIVLENWAYTKNAVDLINGSAGVRKDAYKNNGIWDLVKSSVETTDIYFAMHPEQSFPQMTFWLYLQRKPRYYMINIVLPCVFLISIALLVFWLPPDAGEKVALGMTVLLAFSVFQLVIADNTPENSDCTPMLSIFVALTMGLSTVSVVTSVLVLYLHHRGSISKVPQWLRYLAFKIVARVLCVQITPLRLQAAELNQNRCGKSIDQPEEKFLCKPQNEKDNEAEIEMSSFGSVRPDAAEVGVPLYVLALKTQVNSLTQELKVMTNNIRRRDEEKVIAEEWQIVARVLDRLLFWVVLLIICSSLIWLLCESFREFELDNM